MYYISHTKQQHIAPRPLELSIDVAIVIGTAIANVLILYSGVSDLYVAVRFDQWLMMRLWPCVHLEYQNEKAEHVWNSRCDFDHSDELQ